MKLFRKSFTKNLHALSAGIVIAGVGAWGVPHLMGAALPDAVIPAHVAPGRLRK